MHPPPCQSAVQCTAEISGEPSRTKKLYAAAAIARTPLSTHCLGHGVVARRPLHTTRCSRMGKGWYDARRLFVYYGLLPQRLDAVPATKRNGHPSLRHRPPSHRFVNPMAPLLFRPETCNPHCNAHHHQWKHGLRI